MEVKKMRKITEKSANAFFKVKILNKVIQKLLKEITTISTNLIRI